MAIVPDAIGKRFTELRPAPAEREAIVELSNPWIRQGQEEGRQEGRQLEAASLVTRQLTKRLGALSPVHAEAIAHLPLARLEALAEAVFEIGAEADLEAWLKPC